MNDDDIAPETETAQQLVDAGFSPEVILVSLMLEYDLTVEQAVAAAEGTNSQANFQQAAVAAGASATRVGQALTARQQGAGTPGSNGGSTSGGGGGTAVAEAVRDVLDGTEN